MELSPVVQHQQIPGSAGLTPAPKPSVTHGKLSAIPAAQPQVTQPPNSTPPPALHGFQTPLAPTMSPGMDSTPTQGSPPPTASRRLSFDPNGSTLPSPATLVSSPQTRTKVQHAVARLQPHNKAGNRELLSPRRTRHQRHNGDDMTPTCQE